MKVKKANKLINEILKEDKAEIGVFISLLSNAYIRKIGMSEKEFLRHLKNSLKILK